VRLLLDAHISGSSVGTALRARGHDVRALGQEPRNEGLDDDEVLALATSDRRVLVTHDVTDFPKILREWAETGRSHAGVILIYGIEHGAFGVVIRGVAKLLAGQPRQRDWIDVAAVLSRRASR
jgi:hypothetical protein